MAAPGPDAELRELLREVRSPGMTARAWKRFREHFEQRVRKAITGGLDRVGGLQPGFDLDLEREASRGFWRQMCQERSSLPAEPEEAARALARSAREAADRLANEFSAFCEKLNACKLDVKPILRGCLSANPPPGKQSQKQDQLEESVEDLEKQVMKRLWHIRHQLPADCESLNGRAAEVAEEIGEIGSLLARCDDPDARNRLFEILHQRVLEILRRCFPKMPVHGQEEVAQEVMRKLWQARKRALRPGEINGLLRTAAYRAGLDWLSRNTPPVPAPASGGQNPHVQLLESELLRLTFESDGPPHHVLSFCFGSLLGFTPHEIIDTYVQPDREWTLQELADEFVRMYSSPEHSHAELRRLMAPLYRKLSLPLKDVLVDPNTRRVYGERCQHLLEADVGKTRLSDYAISHLERDIANWSWSIMRSVRGRFLR